MYANTYKIAALGLAVALAALMSSSCSGTVAAKADSSDSYWAAARAAYAAGDYPKTLEHLDRLVDSPNEYTARAIPWALVLSSGMAAGYIEVAQDYTRGAHANPANAAALRLKAAEYRRLASPMVLDAARLVDKLEDVPSGSVLLVFGRPRGSLTRPPALYKIAAGLQVPESDADAAPGQAVESSVLESACLAVGAANDSAKASEILSHASTITPRATFSAAIAQMLEKASTLYAREELDLPAKFDLLQARVKSLRAEAAQPGPAMVVKVQETAQ